MAAQRQTINPAILAQLHDLDNPGPDAIRPSMSRRQQGMKEKAPKTSHHYSEKYGLSPEGYQAKNKGQGLYTPTLSLAEMQQVSNQAYKDSARQTALDLSYAQKASRINQEIGQQNFAFQNNLTNQYDYFKTARDAGIDQSQRNQLFGQQQSLQNSRQRNDLALQQSQNIGAANQAAINAQAQRDITNMQIQGERSIAELSAQTQRELADKQLISNILAGSRSGYQYW